MNRAYMDEIKIDRDPILAVREGHDAIEFALMHPSQFSRKNIRRLEFARKLIAEAMRG